MTERNRSTRGYIKPWSPRSAVHYPSKLPLQLEKNPKYLKQGIRHVGYIPIGQSKTSKNVYVFTSRRRTALLKAGMKRKLFGRRIRHK